VDGFNRVRRHREKDVAHVNFELETKTCWVRVVSSDSVRTGTIALLDVYTVTERGTRGVIGPLRTSGVSSCWMAL